MVLPLGLWLQPHARPSAATIAKPRPPMSSRVAGCDRGSKARLASSTQIVTVSSVAISPSENGPFVCKTAFVASSLTTSAAESNVAAGTPAALRVQTANRRAARGLPGE